MLSSLSSAILALLSTKPQSGYDLARQMKPPLGFMWQAQHGQIYPELAQLVRSRLVALDRVENRSGPPRRIHSITPKGRAELARWVVQTPQLKPANDELVVKAFALQRSHAKRASALIGEQLQEHEKRLAALEQFAEALRARGKSSPAIGSARFGEYAALRRAIGAEREYLAWCRWLLSELPPQATATPKRAAKRPRAAGRPAAGRARG